MKILHVLANLAPRYGGPPKAAQEMARAMAPLGHQVSLYTTNQDGPGVLDVPLNRPVYEGGVEIRFFPIQSPRFWGTSWPLARALREKIPEVDLVHLHSLYLFHGLVTGHLCRKYRIPYLLRPHGTLDPYIHRRHRWRKTLMEWWFENRNIRGAAALHFTSEEEKRLAAPYSCNTPGVVVPLGLNLADYQALPAPGSFRAKYPEVGHGQIILFLGRVNFKKGLDLLVKAFAMVAREREDVHLVIAGPDSDGWGARVRGWVRQGNLSRRVSFTGMLQGQGKLAALRDADLFVLPSYSENFGLAVVEAMACGLPVIISDRVNLWREVAAAGAGKVVPCAAAPTAAALRELLDNPELASRMGRNGRKLVEEHFQWQKVAKNLEEAYGKILDNWGKK